MNPRSPARSSSPQRSAPLSREPIDRADFPFEFHEWLALVAPRPLWIRGTCDDPIFPAWQGLYEIGRQLAPLYPNAAELRVRLDPGEHALPLEVHGDAWQFLIDHL